jgi:hypothetical protein
MLLQRLQNIAVWRCILPYSACRRIRGERLSMRVIGQGAHRSSEVRVKPTGQQNQTSYKRQKLTLHRLIMRLELHRLTPVITLAYW